MVFLANVPVVHELVKVFLEIVVLKELSGVLKENP